MKYILYGFGGSYNHGGEAIIRTTCDLIRHKNKNAKIILATHFKEQDEEFSLPVDGYCVRNMEALAKEKEDGNQNRFTAEVYASVLREITKDSVVMSVGGDNYCYDNWRKWVVIHNYAKKVGAKTVFWSCSIEPSMISEEMISHLKTFDIITARESKTYEALKSWGLENVKKCFDVAFALEAKKVALPNGFCVKNTVAINVSPLVLRRERDNGIILRNVIECVNYILNCTNMSVLLIPHVLMPADNDLDALREIKEKFAEENRVIIFDKNCSSSEYKYVISQCRFGIFARTHAAVAAYSSGVPTIVLGYSVKSVGMAADLGLQQYVLPIEQLQEGKLEECFRILEEKEDEVREQLISLKKVMDEGTDVGRKVLQEI